jgi:hypothetical protein
METIRKRAKADDASAPFAGKPARPLANIIEGESK